MRQPAMMIGAAVTMALFGVLTFVDLPWLNGLTSSDLIHLTLASLTCRSPRLSEAPRNIAGIAAATLLFAALLVLLDGPIWLVKLVPTQDGPVHLAQADLIARFGWGGALQEPAASFYQWNPRIEPNSAIYLLLAGLIRLTGDALMANTLFLSLYGLLWIAAAFAVCRSETERPMLADPAVAAAGVRRLHPLGIL